MKESQSLTNNLLMEIEVKDGRKSIKIAKDSIKLQSINHEIKESKSLKVQDKTLKDIKESFKTTNNKALKERLFLENKNIFKRVNEIYKIAELLNKKNNEKINFSKLLVEISKRILNENKFESNLFFL